MTPGLEGAAARLAALVILISGVWGADVANADDTEVYARVVVDSTQLRSGPGPSFRQVGIALRGDTFLVKRRSTRGYWFQIERPDGTLAWVLGDVVYNHEVGESDDVTRWKVFAPPPLNDARIEIAALFGLLSGGGFMAVRPTILVGPVFGIELTGAAAVSRAGRLLMTGAGAIANIFPNWPVVPYVVVGGGAVFSDPNADTFLLQKGTVAMLYGGGGLRFGFRHRITIRLEVRSYAFFEPDRHVSQEEYSGGLSVFF